MKPILKLYSTLLVTGMLVSGQVFATGDPLVKKTKSYSKTYAVSSSDKVSFDNKFGELKITTWNKNEVKVDVSMTAEANTDEKAQRILDAISIEDGKSGSGVFFKTHISEGKKDKDQKWEKGEKQGFEINYVVYMPANNPLDAHNEFGPMSIGDYSGEATLTSKFGSLTTGNISNAKKISVEFGNGKIGGISNGDVSIKFSQAIISNLTGDIDGNFEFSGVKLNVDNSIKKLDINNSYTSLYLDLSTNLSASFDIDTHFGDLSNKSNFKIAEEKEDDDRYGPRFNHNYNGKAGGGSTPVKIKSSFGNVVLGHNLPDDVIKDKNKNKNKDKTTKI